jgi:hypothetical protein
MQGFASVPAVVGENHRRVGQLEAKIVVLSMAEEDMGAALLPCVSNTGILGYFGCSSKAQRVRCAVWRRPPIGP